VADSALDLAARALAVSLEEGNELVPPNGVFYGMVTIIAALLRDSGSSLSVAAIKEGTDGLLEYLVQLQTDARRAGPQTLEAQKALDRLILRILSKHDHYFEARRAAGM
jgi:hypothetical protein